MGGKCCRKQRRQRRYRAVHQPGQSRLHILQHEHAAPRFVFGFAHVGLQDLAGQPHREIFVALLFLGEIAEQAADADILGPLGGLGVEALGLRAPWSRPPCGWCRAAGSWSARSDAGAEIRGRPRGGSAADAARTVAHTSRAAGGDGRALPPPSPRTAWPSPGSAPSGPRRRSCRCGCPPPRRRSRPPALRARSDRRNSSREALSEQFRIILNYIEAAVPGSTTFSWQRAPSSGMRATAG